MRKNISYAEITCDICGKVEQISQSQSLPEKWKRAEIPSINHSYNNSYELCPECVKKLENVIRCLEKNSELAQNSIREFVLKYNKTDSLERPTAFEVSLLYPEYVFIFNQDTNDIEEYWHFVSRGIL